MSPLPHLPDLLLYVRVIGEFSQYRSKSTYFSEEAHFKYSCFTYNAVRVILFRNRFLVSTLYSILATGCL
ncbi:hypothetical protein GE061_014718 [Apolygus lucorum]|uniref:Uncharacterized protein n=1 Tax=Apolygus lucorum TaxID=248454 RepID=A0A8S9XN10_APOLU|nr:hypothetical protein GE061_014718 [Apolygus lucorum]